MSTTCTYCADLPALDPNHPLNSRFPSDPPAERKLQAEPSKVKGAAEATP